jgi:hypothetical protein
MAVLTAIAIAATVASVGVGIIGQQKQARAAKKAAQLQQNQEKLRVQRERRSAIRQAQMKKAQAENVAFAEGAGMGSGISGGLSSLGSQLGSGLGYSSQMSALSTDIYNVRSKAATSARTFSGIKAGFDLVGSVASYGAKQGWDKGSGGSSPSYTTTGGEGAGSGSAGSGSRSPYSSFRYPGDAY